jgi:hypothetical protein
LLPNGLCKIFHPIKLMGWEDNLVPADQNNSIHQ